MKEILTIQKTRESISLVTGVTYSNVVGWFGATRKDLKMDILMPKAFMNHEPCPCLVWICGGAYMSVDRSVWIPQMMRLAEAGFVIASVEYRTTNEAQFPAPLIDVKTAVRFLRAHAKEYCIDPERIYAAGESAGGTLASLLAVTADRPEFEQGDYLDYSSHVSKVVDFYGLVDLKKTKLIDNDSLPKWIIDAFLGDDYTEEQAEAASAVCYLSKDTVPFFILHGLEDKIVSPNQSTELYDQLTKLGIPADLLLLNGAEHGDDLFYQDEIMDRIIDFLKA